MNSVYVVQLIWRRFLSLCVIINTRDTLTSFDYKVLENFLLFCNCLRLSSSSSLLGIVCNATFHSSIVWLIREFMTYCFESNSFVYPYFFCVGFPPSLSLTHSFPPFWVYTKIFVCLAGFALLHIFCMSYSNTFIRMVFQFVSNIHTSIIFT